MKKLKPFIKKKFKVSNFLIFVLIIAISFIFFRKIIMFLAITIICTLFTYLTYYIKLPFDLSPVLFLSLVISREYSFFLSVVFIITSGVIPMILAGGSFDYTTLFYLSIRFFINFLNTYLISFPLIPVFIFLSIIDHLSVSICTIYLFGTIPSKEMISKCKPQYIFVYSS